MSPRDSHRQRQLDMRPWSSFLCAALLVGIVACCPTAARAAKSPEADQLITQAGNAEDEQTRYKMLKQITALPGLDAQVRQDLDAMLPIVDYWANKTYRPPEPRRRAAENGFLCGFFVSKVRPDRYLLPRIAESSPLYPIWCFYRARMLIHPVIQSGNLLSSPEHRAAYYGQARRLLRVAREAFPENRIICMYLDEPLREWPHQVKPDPQAPQWANLQREGLEKLTHIIHWWIDHQQIENGEFGGGWGDDCEMWRWWVPVMIAFEDPKITAGQERFAQGMFGQAHMKHGYTEFLSDVEHTAEDSADTITPMLHLRPSDPLWNQRALRIAELMRDRWTGLNQRGTLQFKGTYFNVHKVDPNPRRACDTVWHPRVVLPTLLYWMRTRDADLTALFSAWMDTWVDATARAERGKPAGVIPAAIHWPEGSVGGLDGPWYTPQIDSQAHLYDWPGAMTSLTGTLLMTYHITGNDKYLQPIHSMAKIRQAHINRGTAATAEPGTLPWCAARMGFIAQALAKYRVLTQDTQYDDMLMKEANGYVAFRLTGEADKLIRDLSQNAEALRTNWPGYTSEVRWTDRVLAFTSHYLNHYAPSPLPRVNPTVLYATATGDLGQVSYLPLNAVRWLTPPKDIAVLVTSAGTGHLRAELYHFGPAPRDMAAELYLLKPGAYTVTLKTADQTLARQQINITGPLSKVTLQLPPRQLCRLEIAGP